MSELYRQATHEEAIGMVSNYVALAARYGFRPEPEAVIGLLKDAGYSLHRLPRKAEQ